jgi:serine/threonine-protein kinase Stk1
MPGYDTIVEALAIREKCGAGGRFEKPLNDRYAVGARIGVGGLSEVFAAEDAYALQFGDRRRLAVKVPSEALLEKKDVDAFVYAEYAHLLRLSHPNVIKVLDFGIDSDLNFPYIVLEHLQGRLLSTIPPSEAGTSMKKRLVRSLFSTVAYLHAREIVHADINPTNIMYLDDGTFRLFDFGIAINLREPQPYQLDYRTVRAFNPIYAAPEVADGAVPDKKSDLFSLAAVLFEFLGGRLPYRNNPAELQERPLSESDLARLPAGLRSWFGRALSADPAKRPEKIPQMVKKTGKSGSHG